MNKITDRNKVQHPQTVEIPDPLEIHPSIDPELANGLMAALESIAAKPETFCFVANVWEGTRGCVICHAEKFSNWKRPAHENRSMKPYPLGDFQRIFFWDNGNGDSVYEKFGWDTNFGRFARIEHFLRTGE